MNNQYILLILSLFFFISNCNEQHKKIEFNSSSKGPEYKYTQKEFWICLLIGIFLTLCGGLFSGLTVGYLSIDDLQLEIKLKNGSEEEKRAAVKIIPILQQHHALLSTLLIANAIALESLPIFIEKALPSYLAIILCTFMVVFFAEIIPQAYCTGPDQLQIAEKCVPIVKFLMFIFGILAYPLGMFLDWLLGNSHASTRFPRKDLKAVIELHQHDNNNSNHTGLNNQEVILIKQIIDLRNKQVSTIVKPTQEVFMMSSSQRLSENNIDKILQNGYSRIPIYRNKNKNDLLGTIKVKELLTDDKQIMDETIEDIIKIYPPLLLYKNANLLQVLMMFQSQKTNIAFVVDKDNEDEKDIIYKNKLNQQIDIIGLISIKDLYEVLLNRELTDDDRHLNLGSQGIVQMLYSRENQKYIVQPKSLTNIKIQARFKNIRKNEG